MWGKSRQPGRASARSLHPIHSWFLGPTPTREHAAEPSSLTQSVSLTSEPIIVCAPHLTSQGLLIWNTKYGIIRCGYKNTNYSLPSIYNHLSLRSSFMVFRFVNNRKPEPLKDADGDTDADAPNLVWYFRTSQIAPLSWIS